LDGSWKAIITKGRPHNIHKEQFKRKKTKIMEGSERSKGGIE